MEVTSALWAITAGNVLGWFVFGLVAGLGWSIAGWPIYRWRA